MRLDQPTAAPSPASSPPPLLLLLTRPPLLPLLQSSGQLTTDAENYCAFEEKDDSGDALFKFVLKGADGEFYAVATAVPKAGAAKINFFRKLNGGGGANTRCAKIYPAWVKPSKAPAPSTAPTPAPAPKPIAGGFTDDATVPSDIINFITTTFPAYQGATINCSASQVVAGTNYKVIITKDDASYEVGVFQPLPGQGSLQITSDPTPVTDLNAACMALTSSTSAIVPPPAEAPTDSAAVVPSAGEVDVFAPSPGPSMTITPEEIEAMFPTPAREPAAAPALAPVEEIEEIEEVLATGGAVGAKVGIALVAGLLVFLF